jgi:hypothetical protein
MNSLNKSQPPVHGYSSLNPTKTSSRFLKFAMSLSLGKNTKWGEPYYEHVTKSSNTPTSDAEKKWRT